MVKRLLTQDERQIVVLMANGRTNAQIAQLLPRKTTPDAVKARIAKIFRALDVECRSHAVATALRKRLISIYDIEFPPTGATSWQEKPSPKERPDKI